jgi:hypothetical protein
MAAAEKLQINKVNYASPNLIAQFFLDYNVYLN